MVLRGLERPGIGGAGLPRDGVLPAGARAASSLSQGEWSPLPVRPIRTLRFICVGSCLLPLRRLRLAPPVTSEWFQPREPSRAAPRCPPRVCTQRVLLHLAPCVPSRPFSPCHFVTRASLFGLRTFMAKQVKENCPPSYKNCLESHVVQAGLKLAM